MTTANTAVTRFGHHNNYYCVIGNYTEAGGRYCCNQCSYSCSSKDYLLQHIQTRHNCFSPVKVTPHPPVPHIHLYTPQEELVKYWAPQLFIDQLLSFRSKKVNSTKKITGDRRVVHLAGTDSKAWGSFVQKSPQSAQHNVEFLRAFQETAEDIAHSLHNTKVVNMSPDVLALIGAEKEQTPHVDLKPGQFQIIMILAPIEGAISTLFYFHASSPSHADALHMLNIRASSTSSFASVLKYAPALALPKDTLVPRMSSIRDTTSVGSDLVPQGSWILADHTVVHAGPCQPQKNNEDPRIVLFTTFTVGTCTDAYNLKDQYFPAHFGEDPTMPTDRAIKLLQDWRTTKPQESYHLNDQHNACLVLSGKDALDLPVTKKEELLAILRQ